MRTLSPTTEPARFIGSYGPTWRSGLISEHLDLFIRAGGTHRTSAGLGAGWAVVDGVAHPVVCSELVSIDTEDGPVSGRCGVPALDATGACEGHSEERAHWLAMSEAERAFIERHEVFA